MWGSVARIGLSAVTIAVVLYALSQTGWWSGFLLVPIAVGIAWVVARRQPPFVALVTGALVTLGVILLFAVPMIAFSALSGDLDTRGPDCDGFCMDTGTGVLFSSFILTLIAVPTAIAGGVISMIASFVAGRAPRTA